MRRAAYLRLAAANLRRSTRSYIPYLVASAVMCAVCLICSNLALGSSLSNMNYGELTRAVLETGLWVMAFFTAFYMFYLNSFLIKRRAREFGLYGVLGFRRSQTARVVAWEGAILFAASTGLGILLGLALGQGVFRLLLALTRFAPDSRYAVEPSAAVLVVILFAAVFLLNTIYNMFRVWRSRPLELMKTERSGEKRPKGAAAQAVAGAGLLALAYWISLSTESVGVAIGLFFPTVVLVIVATHLIFRGGSVAVLELLRKNKKFYYSKSNFVPVGGLLGRMKKNAAGLANICVLSTMVLVTVAETAALYLGGEAGEDAAHFYAMYGGLLFMGIFFAILFLANMTIIVYFKQVSEGLDDRENFALLRRVGMDEKMIKTTINRQVLIFFFAPLLLAVCHVAAASGMLGKILDAFLYCAPTYLWACIGCTSAAFALCYCVVYRLTSRAYYAAAR